MKVTKIEAFPVNLKYQPGKEFLVSYGVIDSMQNAVVRLHTDEGLVGHGELMPLPLNAREEKIGELKKLAPAVIGQDPFSIREIHAGMDRLCDDPFVKGSVDFALYDLMGKAANVPVYKLLGGSYDGGVPMHFSISIRSPEEMGQDVADRVAEGFRTIEVKLGRFEGQLELDTEIARIKAIREAAGDDVIIVADPNTGWTPEEAIRVLPSIEKYNVYVEQPVRGLTALAQVHAAIESPMIADESCGSAAAVARIVRENAADMINLKILRVGGIYQAKRMMEACEAFGIGYRHDNVIQSRLGATMCVHFATTYSGGLPDGGGTQFMRTVEDIVKDDEGLVMEGGVAKLRNPDAPGMGATPKEDLLGKPVVFS